MLGNEAQSGVAVEALRSTSFTAGAANGVWLPVSQYEGDLCFMYNIGALTGSVVLKLQDATDVGGTGAADLSPAVTTGSLSTAGGTGQLTVPKSKIRSHVRIVATVTTGPALVSAMMKARSKTTP